MASPKRKKGALKKPAIRVVAVGLGGCGAGAIERMVKRGSKVSALIAADSLFPPRESTPEYFDIPIGAIGAIGPNGAIGANGPNGANGANGPNGAKGLLRESTPEYFDIPIGPKGPSADGSQKPGRRAINESLSKITKTIGKAQMVLVIAGLGGSVGTAAITPLVERLKKRKKAPLVVSVVVLPFVWEWTRSILAKKTVETLLVKSDSVIAVSNDKVHLSNPGAKMPQCLAMADGLLDLAVSSLTDLVYQPGEMNLDFADLRTALSAGDLGVMGFGEAKGPNRSIEAARTALNSPLMETKSLTGAKYFLIQLNAPKDLKASEFIALNEFLIKGLSPLAQVFLGLTYDENLRDSVKVIVIATGTLSDKKDPQVPKGP